MQLQENMGAQMLYFNAFFAPMVLVLCVIKQNVIARRFMKHRLAHKAVFDLSLTRTSSCSDAWSDIPLLFLTVITISPVDQQCIQT